MPKTSKHIDLKPVIEEHFRQGKTAYDVVKLYPGISPGLVYNWFRKFTEPDTESDLNKELNQTERLTGLEKIEKIESTLLGIMTDKIYINNHQLAKIRLAAAEKLLDMVKVKLSREARLADKEARLDEHFKDADDITRYFGEHLRINEISPPKLIEVAQSNFDSDIKLGAQFSIRGFTYEIIGQNKITNKIVCEKW